MKVNSIVAGAALAIAALSVVSAPALARLDGADRQAFIESSVKSCSDTALKTNPKLPAKTIETYCSCMADAEADMTTAADVEYMSAHNEPPADYTARVRALAPACNAKAGLK
jgi:hypothetical protein